MLIWAFLEGDEAPGLRPFLPSFFPTVPLLNNELGGRPVAAREMRGDRRGLEPDGRLKLPPGERLKLPSGEREGEGLWLLCTLVVVSIMGGIVSPWRVRKERGSEMGGEPFPPPPSGRYGKQERGEGPRGL